MNSTKKIQTLLASSNSTDEKTAIAELRAKVFTPATKLVLFFCSSSYDLDKLTAELNAAFPCAVVGCTSAGQIDALGFSGAQISAVGISGEISIVPHLIDLDQTEEDVKKIAASLGDLPTPDQKEHAVGLLLVDGLAMLEENVSSLLYHHLPEVPFAGGSAGDDLKFIQTYVFCNNAFHKHAAVFTIFKTSHKAIAFKFEHYTPTERLVVVTAAHPERRLIYELNGEKAAEAYARALNLKVEDLNPLVFCSNPLLLALGEEQYIRSIKSANADGSLSLFCAIEDGVVLSLGKVSDPIASTSKFLDGVKESIGNPAIIIGCDCAFRKLDFDNFNVTKEASALYSRHTVFGFSTYGEQFNGIHSNQTLTGIAISEEE